MKWTTVLVFLSACVLIEAAPEAKSEDIEFEALPPGRSQLESADALLSDWEGDHWASLDGDQDKVALSWSIVENEAVFQVRTHKPEKTKIGQSKNRQEHGRLFTLFTLFVSRNNGRNFV